MDVHIMKWPFVAAAIGLTLHGIEEIWTGFYALDSFSLTVFGPLLGMSSAQSTFIVFQVMLWLMFLICYLLLFTERWRFLPLGILGFFLFFELHHVVKAILIGGYYPGMITALILPIIGMYYWKALVFSIRAASKKM